MSELVILGMLFMVFIYYMTVNFAVVIDKSNKEMTLIGISPKSYPEDE